MIGQTKNEIKLRKIKLHGSEICSILNNALQNIQGAVMRLDEERCKWLAVTRKTEKDTDNLTFIRIATEQLGGNISINTNDSLFCAGDYNNNYLG